MLRAAQLPATNIGKIPVFYFGRSISVPGDRTFEEWTTTVINDEDFLIRNGLEKWSNAMNAFTRNVVQNGPEVNNYKSTGIFRAFGKDGRVLREYQMNGLFPLTVSAIEADWSSTDTISEYQVVWHFDDFEILEGSTGTPGTP
jgi:hypothetical protein